MAAFIDITAISNLRKTQSSRYNPNNLLYLDCVIMLTEHEDIRPSWSKTRSKNGQKRSNGTTVIMAESDAKALPGPSFHCGILRIVAQ